MVHFRPQGTDTVPAMLTPGEFVINRSAAQKNLPLLQAINNGSKGYSSGGVIYAADGAMIDMAGSGGGGRASSEDAKIRLKSAEKALGYKHLNEIMQHYPAMIEKMEDLVSPITIARMRQDEFGGMTTDLVRTTNLDEQIRQLQQAGMQAEADELFKIRIGMTDGLINARKLLADAVRGAGRDGIAGTFDDMTFLDDLSTNLAAASLASPPILSQLFDVLSLPVDAMRGDAVGVGLSLASMGPIAGRSFDALQVARGTKLSRLGKKFQAYRGVSERDLERLAKIMNDFHGGVRGKSVAVPNEMIPLMASIRDGGKLTGDIHQDVVRKYFDKLQEALEDLYPDRFDDQLRLGILGGTVRDMTHSQ